MMYPNLLATQKDKWNNTMQGFQEHLHQIVVNSSYGDDSLANVAKYCDILLHILVTW